MLKIKVYSIGKTKEEWLQDAVGEYEKRLKATLSFEWILAKSDEQLKQFLEKRKISFASTRTESNIPAKSSLRFLPKRSEIVTPA